MNEFRFPYFCRHTIVVGGAEYSTLLLLIQRRLQSPGFWYWGILTRYRMAFAWLGTTHILNARCIPCKKYKCILETNSLRFALLNIVKWLWHLILKNNSNFLLMLQDLEEALLTDSGTEGHLLQELIVRLLEGCLPDDTRNEISTFNYQMFLRRLFRKKCQVCHDVYLKKQNYKCSVLYKNFTNLYCILKFSGIQMWESIQYRCRFWTVTTSSKSRNIKGSMWFSSWCWRRCKLLFTKYKISI